MPDFRGVSGNDAFSQWFEAAPGIIEVVAICDYTYVGCATTNKDFRIGSETTELDIAVAAGQTDRYGQYLNPPHQRITLVDLDGRPLAGVHAIVRDALAHHFYGFELDADGAADFINPALGSVLVVPYADTVFDLPMPVCKAKPKPHQRCTAARIIVPARSPP